MPKFAVIETGGKQYKVSSGDELVVDPLTGPRGGKLKEGDSVTFDKVLLVDDGKNTQIGDPYLKGAKVEATIDKAEKGEKLEVLKFKSKSRYLRRKGHRQDFMTVNIKDIK